MLVVVETKIVLCLNYNHNILAKRKISNRINKTILYLEIRKILFLFILLLIYAIESTHWLEAAQVVLFFLNSTMICLFLTANQNRDQIILAYSQV